MTGVCNSVYVGIIYVGNVWWYVCERGGGGDAKHARLDAVIWYQCYVVGREVYVQSLTECRRHRT